MSLFSLFFLQLELNKITEKIKNRISVNSPVFLTQNGQGRFVLMDIDEYEHTKATISLLAALAEGEQSASAQGCMSLEEVERNLGL